MSVVLIRTVILYAVIVLALRIMGKRQMGELQPSELVITILISNIATLSIEDSNIPLLGSILPIFMLVCCEVVTSLIILKSIPLRKVITGSPRVVIRDGVINQQELRSLRWTLDDLTEQLRVGNVFDIGEVAYAVVETSGHLSVYPKYPHRPATAAMLNQTAPQQADFPPQVIISDGKVIPEALRACNLRSGWLDKVLLEHALAPAQIFLMTCDRQANYYLVPREAADK